MENTEKYRIIRAARFDEQLTVIIFSSRATRSGPYVSISAAKGTAD